MDPVKALLKYKWRILLWGTLIFLVLMPAAWFFRSTSYLATATLRVSPNMPSLLDVNDRVRPGGYQEYARTQAARVASVQNLMAALNRVPPKVRSQFVDPDESVLKAAVRLRKELMVGQVERTHLIDVALKKRDPEGLPELVNTVVNVYLERVEEEEQGSDNRRVTYLQQEKKQLVAKIARQTKMVRNLSKAAGLASFEEEDNIYRVKLREIQMAYLRAQNQHLEAKRLYDSALKEADELRALPLEGLVEEQIENNPLLSSGKATAFSNELEIEGSLKGYTEEHPDRLFFEKRQDGIEQKLEELEEDVRDQTERILASKRNAQIEESLIRAKHQYELYAELEKDLKEKFDSIEEEVEKQASLLVRGQQAQAELLYLSELLAKVEDRIYSLQVESKAPGRVSLESIARPVEVSNLKKLLAACFLLSYGMIAALYFLREIRDPFLRTPQDVESCLGSPPSWPIPDIRESSSASFARATLDAPGTVSSKALRSLAVKLNRERVNHGGKVAVFTGTCENAGVSSILMNCAHAMADMCPQTLVIDMNRHHPSLQTLGRAWGKVLATGQILTKKEGLKKCVVRDEDRGVDLLLLEGIVQHKSLNRSEFSQILNQAREIYDCILIDSAPLLESDLTEFLCTQSDIIVTVVVANRSQFIDLHRVMSLLSRMGVSAVAPVLNGFGSRKKGRKRKKRLMGLPWFLQFQPERRRMQRMMNRCMRKWEKEDKTR